MIYSIGINRSPLDKRRLEGLLKGAGASLRRLIPLIGKEKVDTLASPLEKGRLRGFYGWVNP